MSGPLGHDAIAELLGAYALDAVDPYERDQVEAHLRTCPRCRAEVAEHREVAALLAQSGAAAPDGLWDRIAGALDEAPPQLRLAVTPPPRRSFALRNLAIAAAVLVVVGAIATLAFAVADQRRTIDRIEAQHDLASAADRAFADPRARTAELRTGDGAVQAIAVVRPSGEGYLVAGDLPPLPRRIYQLWGISGDTVVSLGVLGSEPGVVGFSADGDFDELAVTAEEQPVPAPTRPPVVHGVLT